MLVPAARAIVHCVRCCRCDDHCLEVLLPHLAEVRVERVEFSTVEVRIWARPKADQVPCPGCGRPSARVHRRYRRRLADAAVGGRRVVIVLRVRLLVCQDRGCSVRRFAEQVAGLTAPRARRSSGLRAALEAIGLALAGRAAVRLAARLGLSASRTTAWSYASCRLARVAAARVTYTASSAPPIGAVWRRWWASGVAQHRHHVVEELKPGAGGGRLGQQRRRPAQ